MEIPLSSRGLRWLDRISKLIGLVLLAAALEGSLGRWSLLAGFVGLLIGGGTIFLEPPE